MCEVVAAVRGEEPEIAFGITDYARHFLEVVAAVLRELMHPFAWVSSQLRVHQVWEWWVFRGPPIKRGLCQGDDIPQPGTRCIRSSPVRSHW